ncbi:hypothetical protein K1X84_10020 [bacterium]|nr:hypothetical protein [bacterium]
MKRLLSCLRNDIKFEQIEGNFSYYESDYSKNMFKSVFVSNYPSKLRYISCGSVVSDTLFFDNTPISIPKQMPFDPLAAKLYRFVFEGQEYFCMLSKASSASGSGMEVTFYTLIETENSHIENVTFFSSRFGIVENIGDFNGDRKLDYIKLTHGKESKEYFAKLYSIKSPDAVLDDGHYLIIRYKGNDLFCIDKWSWSFEANCK